MKRDLFAVGAISILAQVVLLRELSVAFYGSELVYILALGVWLIGSAAGALAGRRPVATQSPPGVSRLFLAVAILLPLAGLWTRAARPLLGGVPGAYLPFGRQLLALALAVFPISFVCGRLFRHVAQRAVTLGRTLAGAYALESAGALVGGAAATLLLCAGLANLAGLLVSALAAAVMTRLRRTADAIFAVGLVLVLATSSALDRASTAWTHSGLLAVRDTPYGRVTLTRWGGQLNVFANDALAYETGGTAAEEFVTVAALAHPDPRRILILGGGATGLVGEALRQRPLALDSVELDGTLERLLVRYLPAELRAPLAAPGVRVTIGDPRRFLAERPDRYDLILVGMPEPSSGQANRYYTEEFFAECAARLGPGGVLGFRLPAAENLWAPALVRRMASIDRALRTVFRDALWLPGTTSVVLASQSPLARDPDTLAARLAARRLAPRLVTPPYLRYLLTNDRTAEIGATLAAARAPANRDAQPICYQYTLILWLAKFYPALAYLSPWRLAGGTRWALAGAALGILALAAWLTRGRRGRRAVVVGVAGFAGMGIESLLLLAYQARSGVLYQNLGLLLMAFMAGLALGAFLVDRAQRPEGGGRGRVAWLLLALAALAVALAAGVAGGIAPGLVATGIGLLGAGALTAALFAEVSRGAGDQAAAVGPLYGADLIGGCVGSLAASLVLIPLLGLAGTALAVAAVVVAALAGA